jgi:hypothetical protein
VKYYQACAKKVRVLHALRKDLFAKCCGIFQPKQMVMWQEMELFIQQKVLLFKLTVLVVRDFTSQAR